MPADSVPRLVSFSAVRSSRSSHATSLMSLISVIMPERLPEVCPTAETWICEAGLESQRYGPRGYRPLERRTRWKAPALPIAQAPAVCRQVAYLNSIGLRDAHEFCTGAIDEGRGP